MLKTSPHPSGDSGCFVEAQVDRDALQQRGCAVELWPEGSGLSASPLEHSSGHGSPCGVQGSHLWSSSLTAQLHNLHETQTCLQEPHMSLDSLNGSISSEGMKREWF